MILNCFVFRVMTAALCDEKQLLCVLMSHWSVFEGPESKPTPITPVVRLLDIFNQVRNGLVVVLIFANT